MADPETKAETQTPGQARVTGSNYTHSADILVTAASKAAQAARGTFAQTEGADEQELDHLLARVQAGAAAGRAAARELLLSLVSAS